MSAPNTGRLSLPALTRLARTLGMAALEAVSAGLGGWAISAHRLIPAYVLRNEIDSSLRRWVFIDIAVALGVAGVIVAAVFVWKRRRGLDILERLVRRMAPLSLAGLVPFLFDHRIWADRDLVFLPLVLIFGFGTAGALRTVWSTEPVFPALRDFRIAAQARLRFNRPPTEWPRARVAMPLVCVIVGACAYAVYFSAITIANHRNFGTSAFDLGGEDNLVWNLVHRGPLFKSSPFSGPSPATHFGHHATFFAYVLAPVYWLAPRPETLLVIQAVLLGGAAIPLYLYAARHLPRWTAALVSYSYLAYAPLHGANLYDFHYLPIGIFFLWLVLYAVDARRHVLAIVGSVLALSVREDVAFCLAVLGTYFLLTGTAARSGALLALVGAAYFLVMKLVVMPHFSDGTESFVNQYAALLPAGEHTFGSMLKTIIGNPPFTANVLFEHDKLVYVFKLFTPLLFVPFWRPIGIVLAFPGFLFTLLSTGYWPLYQISFQYTSYWIAFAFIGVVIALERSARTDDSTETSGTVRRRALAAGLAAASLACSYLYGAVVPHENLRAGFEPPRIVATEADLSRRSQFASILAQVPSDAKVSASEHLLPHVSSRRDAYTLRFGIYDADYLLVEIPIRGDERVNAAPVLQNGSFGVVDDRGAIVLARRGHDTAKNAATLVRLGQ